MEKSQLGLPLIYKIVGFLMPSSRQLKTKTKAKYLWKQQATMHRHGKQFGGNQKERVVGDY